MVAVSIGHAGLGEDAAAGRDVAADAAGLAVAVLVVEGRELGEELGVAVALTRVAKLPASEKTGQEFIWLYQARHDGPFELARAEIEHGEFFPTEIVSGWVKARPNTFAPGFAECWGVFREAQST